MISLDVKDIESGYGEVQIVWGLSMQLQEGCLTAMVGSNGSGKTTLLRTLTGLLPTWKGTVTFDGKDITRLSPHEKAEMGIVLVPEGRQLFTDMTVLENLEMGATPSRARAEYKKNLAWVFELLPRLKERMNQAAGTLSGGEQQMLAIGRALMAQPKLLLLDEPLLGLSPLIQYALVQAVKQIRAQTGISILIAEQYARPILPIIDYGYIIENGSTVLEGTGAELMDNPDVQSAYFGL